MPSYYVRIVLFRVSAVKIRDNMTRNTVNRKEKLLSSLSKQDYDICRCIFLKKNIYILKIENESINEETQPASKCRTR